VASQPTLESGPVAVAEHEGAGSQRLTKRATATDGRGTPFPTGGQLTDSVDTSAPDGGIHIKAA
jgi:hypothetical protein